MGSQTIYLIKILRRTIAQAEAMARRNEVTQDQDSSSHRFDIGDWVKLKMKKKNKWERQWAGPFTVMRLHFPHTYFLMTMRGAWLPDPINEERMAIWKGRSNELMDPTDNEAFDYIVSDQQNVEDDIGEGEDDLLATQ